MTAGGAVEVCVVGGGPAGATVAARLAALGHDVAVVERERFPRAHVGESLSPAAWPLLEALGVAGEVARAGFEPTETARVLWRGGAEEQARSPGGLTVDRGRFDALLLRHAVAAGARVLAPAAARRPHHDGASWRLRCGAHELRARFVVDTSGRRRLLGGRRTAVGAPTFALHAWWRHGPPPDGAQTRIEALADGWLWGARLPGGGFRAMAFVDADALATRSQSMRPRPSASGAGDDRGGAMSGADGGGHSGATGGGEPVAVRERRAGRGAVPRARAAALLRELLASSRLFADLGAPSGAVRVCDATSYIAGEPIEGCSARAGEAAFAIDPLSACGVQTAIGSGLAAAAALHTLLSPGGDASAARAFYAEQVRHAVARHAANAAAVYAEHGGDSAFWRRRAGAPVAAASRSRPVGLDTLLARRVRLAPAAALRATPCLVGDRIELRRALTHPALDRPVAFLGGCELAPLLDGLARAGSLGDAIDRWPLSPGRAREIARWLAQHDVIEIVSRKSRIDRLT